MMMNDIIKELDRLIPNPVCPLNYTKDYELLIAVMLSAQTTDDRVNEVTKELFKYDIYSLSKLDETIIEKIIKPVGTQKRKAHFVREISRMLVEDYNGVVPYNREYIESLPGVGHKTCNVLFSEIFHEPAFAVDTHVNRVSKRLGIAKEEDDVKIVEKKLCEYFPKEKWRKLHIQFVLFGRTICKSKGPKCDVCPFKNNQCKNT